MNKIKLTNPGAADSKNCAVSPPLRANRRRGQSMVEFALLAPMLFLILFGIVDLGRAVFYANELTNAAREGARVAILASNPCNTQIANPSTTCASSSGSGVDVCSAVKNEANLIPSANWTCGENTVAVPPCTSGCSANANNAYVEVDSLASCTTSPTYPTSTLTPRGAGNSAIKVTITFYYRPLTGLVAVFFPNNFFIRSTTCARQEW